MKLFLKNPSNLLVSFVLCFILGGCASLFSDKNSIGRDLQKACEGQSKLNDAAKTKAVCDCMVKKHKNKLSPEDMTRLLELYRESDRKVPITDSPDSQLWEYDVQTAESCL